MATYCMHLHENEENAQEKSSKLIQQVNNNPSIKSILYVPINVGIICHLFLLNSMLPNTIILLCLNLILRHINTHGDIEVDYTESLQDLEAPYGEQFYKLCLLSYKGSEDDKLVFCSHELKKYNIEVSKISSLV